jgi:nucleotide-binding universal stress UspA family protein
MAGTRVLAVFVGVWVSVGLGCAFVMWRRGHHLLVWSALGIVFGPLVIPLAVESARDERRVSPVVEAGSHGAGSVDVLIGVDGSAEARAAMCWALELFAGRLGRIALAAVLDYDTFGSSVRWNERDEAARELERDASEIARRGAPRPATVLLAGSPAEALRSYAAGAAFDLIVVGRHGHGASRALLGSVASRLARESSLPVLLAGPRAPRAVETRHGAEPAGSGELRDASR